MIEVDAPVVLVDQAVHVRIVGLPPRVAVGVTASVDVPGGRWLAGGSFAADDAGVVDLERARPRSGTYAGADGMGLFWSMVPTGGARSASLPASDYQVRLSVRTPWRPAVTRVLTRVWARPGVVHRSLSVHADGVAGELYLPPAGTTRRPAVLLLGGSEGGISGGGTAALLAWHGFPALAVGYFAVPGRPSTLHGIDLDYFARAARLLAARPGADPHHVFVLGYSRGSEAALLLAQHYPTLIHGTIVYAPSATVYEGFPGGGTAWTWHGQPIPDGTIPLDHVDGPVLAIAGTDDHLWPSATAARQIATELARAPYPGRALVYPGAGHGVGTYPNVPDVTRLTQPIDGEPIDLGGTPAADNTARRTGWTAVLTLLAHPPHGR